MGLARFRRVTSAEEEGTDDETEDDRGKGEFFHDRPTPSVRELPRVIKTGLRQDGQVPCLMFNVAKLFQTPECVVVPEVTLRVIRFVKWSGPNED